MVHSGWQREESVLTRPTSTRLVTMTMVAVFSCQTILQKSYTVSCIGPVRHINRTWGWRLCPLSVSHHTKASPFLNFTLYNTNYYKVCHEKSRLKVVNNICLEICVSKKYTLNFQSTKISRKDHEWTCMCNEFMVSWPSVTNTSWICLFYSLSVPVIKFNVVDVYGDISIPRRCTLIKSTC